MTTTLTRSEYRRIPRDYKGRGADGLRYVVRADETGATCAVPVTIIPDPKRPTREVAS